MCFKHSLSLFDRWRKLFKAELAACHSAPINQRIRTVFKFLIKTCQYVFRKSLSLIKLKFETIKEKKRIKWPSFLPLKPNIYKDSNLIYVKELNSAIKSGAKNIALSGNYGTGKSSILEQFKKQWRYSAWIPFRRNKIKTFTLLSLRETFDGKTNKKTSSELQNEILRQLLYGIRPAKLWRSKYYFIGKNRGRPTRFLIAACATFFCALLLPIDRFTKIIESTPISPLIKAAPGILNCAIVVATFLTFLFIISAIFRLFYSFRLKEVSAKGFSVRLEDADLRFDKQLDEIINAVIASRSRVFIFEDLDRAADMQIFDDLRKLNLMLNQRLDKRGVFFIYAVRDSLGKTISIETKDANSESSIERHREDGPIEERAKFFDQIVPVVPFMTSSNITDYVVSEFSKAGISLQDSISFNGNTNSTQVIGVIAKYVPDMRSLRLLINTTLNYASVLSCDALGLERRNMREIIGISLLRLLMPNEIDDSNPNNLLDKIYSLGLELEVLIKRDISLRRLTLARSKDNNNLVANLFISEIAGRFSNYSLRTKASGYTISEFEQMSNKQAINIINSKTTPLTIATRGKDIALRNNKLEELCPDTYDAIRTIQRGSAFYRIAEEKISGQCEIFELVSSYARGANTSDILLNESRKRLHSALRDKDNNIITDLIEAKMLTSDYSLYLSKITMQYRGEDYLFYKTKVLNRGLIDFYAPLSKESIDELLSELPESSKTNLSLYNINIVDECAIRDTEKTLRNIANIKPEDEEHFFSFLDSYARFKLEHFAEIHKDVFVSKEDIFNLSITTVYYAATKLNTTKAITTAMGLAPMSGALSGLCGNSVFMAIRDYGLELPAITFDDFGMIHSEGISSIYEFAQDDEIKQLIKEFARKNNLQICEKARRLKIPNPR